MGYQAEAEECPLVFDSLLFDPVTLPEAVPILGRACPQTVSVLALEEEP